MKCLGCYNPLNPTIDLDPGQYHRKCSRRLFGTDASPHVDFGSDQLEDLAKIAINQHLGLTGVQPKISVELEKNKNDPHHRLFIVGLWGNFILKPSSLRFPEMSVIEDLTMHMARCAGIPTAQHGLIQLKSGELAYITRRFDREKSGRSFKKVAVEDFCQLSGLLTERKYKTSMEKAGKIILKYSSNPGLDSVAFFDLSLFSFLTGNADMHLKNFSLMANERGEIGLSPAYDLVSTKILPIKDPEEMALTLHGKKAQLKKSDFQALGQSLAIPEKALDNSFGRLAKAVPQMKQLLNLSFLSPQMMKRFEQVIDERAARLIL